MNNEKTWELLSPEEKKQELFFRQKELLDTLLSTGAISQAQHDKSLNCLIEKWGSETKTFSIKVENFVLCDKKMRSSSVL